MILRHLYICSWNVEENPLWAICWQKDYARLKNIIICFTVEKCILVKNGIFTSKALLLVRPTNIYFLLYFKRITLRFISQALYHIIRWCKLKKNFEFSQTTQEEPEIEWENLPVLTFEPGCSKQTHPTHTRATKKGWVCCVHNVALVFSSKIHI